MTQIQTTDFIRTEEFIADLISEFPILRTYSRLDRKLHLLYCEYTSMPHHSSSTKPIKLLSHTDRLFESFGSISYFLGQHIRDRLQVAFQLIQSSTNEVSVKKEAIFRKAVKLNSNLTKEKIELLQQQHGSFFITLSHYVNNVELEFFEKKYCPFLGDAEFIKIDDPFRPESDKLVLFNQFYGTDLDKQLDDAYLKVSDVGINNVDFNRVFRIDSQCYKINYNLQTGTYSLIVDRVFPNLETDCSFEKIKGGIFLNQELSYESYYFLKQPIEIPFDALYVEGISSISQNGYTITQKAIALKKALDNNWISSEFINDKNKLKVNKKPFHDMLNKLGGFTDEERSLFGSGSSDFFRSDEVKKLIKTRQGRPPKV